MQNRAVDLAARTISKAVKIIFRECLQQCMEEQTVGMPLDEDESNNATNETQKAEKYRDEDEANKAKIKAESVEIYRVR